MDAKIATMDTKTASADAKTATVLVTFERTAEPVNIRRGYTNTEREPSSGSLQLYCSR